MIQKKKILVILMSVVMISSMSFQFAFAAQTESNVESNNNNTLASDEGIKGGQQNTSGSDTGSAKASRRAPEADTVTDLSKYLTDKSTVQFKYEDPDTKNTYTVNYSLSSGNVSKDGNTDIKDKEGKDLDIYHLKNIRVLLAATFSNDEKITTDQTFTYTLPDSQGVTWTGSTEWQDLKGSDGTSYGSYQVAGNKLQIKFNKTFINLENRFASVTIESTFDNSGFTGDKNLTFAFPGIGTFVGKLVVPKTLAIKKMDSRVKVDKDSDIVDAAENHSIKYENKTAAELDDDESYPYIWLSDDGAYLTQMLKVTVTGDQSGLVIEDFYNARCNDGSYYFYALNNNWKYNSTIKLVKKSADGTTETLNEGTDYTISDNNGVVGWALKKGVKDGDVIYVAYKAKYDDGAPINQGYGYIDALVGVKAQKRSSYEVDCARTKSDDVAHYTYDSIQRYLGNYSVSKSKDKVDTANKTIHWVIYYNLGMNFNLLDGQTIRDEAKQGKLTPENDSLNVTLIPIKGRSKIVKPSQFDTDGVKLVTNGKAEKGAGHGDWNNFNAETFMSSSGYKIPEGTGCGSLKIEFTTKYDDPVSNTQGSAYVVENVAYYNKEYCSEVVDVSPAGLAYPAWLMKDGKFAENEQGKSDQRTGKIKWTSRFAISRGKGLKLEYRDKIGFGQRLVMDDENYPMTVTYSDTGVSGSDREIERYRKGVSDDPDAVYYELKINNDIDKSYGDKQISPRSSEYGDPSFVVRFVNSNGEDVKLSEGYYTLNYYTYFSPCSGETYYSNRENGDVGVTSLTFEHRNNAWLVYNDDRNYVFVK